MVYFSDKIQSIRNKQSYAVCKLPVLFALMIHHLLLYLNEIFFWHAVQQAGKIRNGACQESFQSCFWAAVFLSFKRILVQLEPFRMLRIFGCFHGKSFAYFGSSLFKCILFKFHQCIFIVLVVLVKDNP